MASQRPSPTEMQSLFVEFGLPIEPRPYDEASESNTCQIYLNQYWDVLCNFKPVVYPLEDELVQLPYTNKEWAHNLDSIPNETCRNVTIVYITDFFTDGRDFAYYILGKPDMSAFSAGMNGMQAYGRPLAATPIFSDDHDSLHLDRFRVRSSRSPMEVAKWKYLYETARIAWSKLVIDPRKVETIKSRNAHMLQLTQSSAAREAGEIQAATSAKEHGKLEFDSVEELVSPESTPENAANLETSPVVHNPAIEAPTPDTPTVNPSVLDIRAEAVRANHVARLHMFFNVIKNTAHDSDNINQRCKKLVMKTCGSSIRPGFDPLVSHRTKALARLLDDIKLERALELEQQLNEAQEQADVLDSLKSKKDDLFNYMLNVGVEQQRLNEARPEEPRIVGMPPKLTELTKEQDVKLEHLVSIIGQSKARALSLLAQNHWSLEAATAAHYDNAGDEAANSDEEEEISNAIAQSWNDFPEQHFSTTQADVSIDRYVSTKSSGSRANKTKPSKRMWLPNPTRAGPSGWKKLPKLTKEEEAAELEATRRKFEQMIRELREEEQDKGQPEDDNEEGNDSYGEKDDPDNDDQVFGATQDLIEHQKTTDPTLKLIHSRIQQFKQENQQAQKRTGKFSPKLAKLLRQEHVIVSLELQNIAESASIASHSSIAAKTKTGAGQRAFQTALDVVNGKKRLSSERDDDGNPTKKRMLSPAGDDDGSPIRKRRGESGLDPPEGELTRAPHSNDVGSMIAQVEDPIDFQTQLATLLSLDLADDQTCMQVLLRNRGNLDCSILQLQNSPDGRSDQPVAQTAAKNENRPTSSILALPGGFEEFEGRLAKLKILNLADEQTCFEQLMRNKGDLDLTISQLQDRQEEEGEEPTAQDFARKNDHHSPSVPDFSDPEVFAGMKAAMDSEFGEMFIKALNQARGNLPLTAAILQKEMGNAHAELEHSPIVEQSIEEPPIEQPVDEQSLEDLRAMGFPNEKRNREMLALCNNDVEAAIEELLKPGSEDTTPGNSDEETEIMERALVDEEKQAMCAVAISCLKDLHTVTPKEITLGGFLTQPQNKTREFTEETNSFPPMLDTNIDPEPKFEGKGKGRAVDVESEARDRYVSDLFDLPEEKEDSDDVFVDEDLASAQNEWLAHLRSQRSEKWKDDRRDSKLEAERRRSVRMGSEGSEVEPGRADEGLGDEKDVEMTEQEQSSASATEPDDGNTLVVG